MKRNLTDSKALYWILINIGTLLLSAGVYFFKAPNHFATGGVSGISILLSALPIPLKQSHWVMIINIALMLLGFIILGKGAMVKTIYCSLVYSAENMLFEYLLPLESPLTGQPMLEFIFAMLLTGIGSAIIFNCGASSGGTDIIALILKKYTKLNVGKSLLCSDLLIATSTFFVFGIEPGLYSLLGLFSKAFIIDGVIESIGKSKYITVITTSPEPIADFIINELNRSYTIYDAQGGYSHECKKIMITVCNRSEAMKIKEKVKEVDPASFVIVTDANEIIGKGFRGTI